jgi:hypothetical protein
LYAIVLERFSFLFFFVPEQQRATNNHPAAQLGCNPLAGNFSEVFTKKKWFILKTRNG